MIKIDLQKPCCQHCRAHSSKASLLQLWRRGVAVRQQFALRCDMRVRQRCRTKEIRVTFVCVWYRLVRVRVMSLVICG